MDPSALTLPLDRVPDVAPLPPGSRMPLTPNPLFVGRAADLTALAVALAGGATAAISAAAATGLGGIGKTQLASEFAHRYGRFFAGGVFWLNCADAEILRAEVVSCGLAGGLDLPTGFADMPQAEQVELVWRAWHAPTPRLLIFDNCEDPKLLAQWRPRSGGCRVLVTSRRAEWDVALGLVVRRLGVLARSESVALLRRFRPDLPLDDAELDALAADLGDLPLALHLAGSYLARYQDAPFGQPAAYRAELARGALLDHPSLAPAAGPYLPTFHDWRVARTFDLSFAQLDAAHAVDDAARALLQRASYLAWGEPIPHDLLIATLDLPDDDADAARAAEDGLARLRALGLITREEEGALRLHRLLARFVRDVADGEEARAAVEQALIGHARTLNVQGYPAQLAPFQPHLRDVIAADETRADERMAELCNELGYHLNAIGDYAAARPYYERALAIREQVLGATHPNTALSLNNLGALLDSQGDYATARPYFERALAICEQVLGATHPATARSLNNLAVLCAHEGVFAEAARLLRRALAISEHALGPDHPDTQSSRSSLAAIEQQLAKNAPKR